MGRARAPEKGENRRCRALHCLSTAPSLALLQGFGDRLLFEMRKLAPKDVKIKIMVPPERKYSTWLG